MHSLLNKYKDLTKQKEKIKTKYAKFEFDGNEYLVSDTGSVRTTTFNKVPFSLSYYPNSRSLKVEYQGKKIEVDLNSLSFFTTEEDLKKQADLQNQIDNISHFFSEKAQYELNLVTSLSKTVGVINLEKFTLPIVDWEPRKTPTVIYIATYKNGIEIYGSGVNLGLVENINLGNYIGRLTEEQAIAVDPLGKIERGVVYCQQSPRHSQQLAIKLYKGEITQSMNNEKLAIIAENYKNSDEYDKDYEYSQKVKEAAEYYYAKKKFEGLPATEQQLYISKVQEKAESYVISMQDGKPIVSLLYRANKLTAFN